MICITRINFVREVWNTVFADQIIQILGCVWGPRGVIGGLLYKVWEVYGDPRGVIGGRLYEVWEVYGDPKGS